MINLTERPEGSNISEKHLLEVIDSRRERLMAELIVRAQAVLRANNNQADFVPEMALRMADFGTLILRVAKEEGWESDAWGLVNDWHAVSFDLVRIEKRLIVLRAMDQRECQQVRLPNQQAARAVNESEEET